MIILNKRIRKKINKRFGIFHYNDFKPTNPNISIRIIDRMNYVSKIHSIDGKSINIIRQNKTIYKSSKFTD